MPATSWVRFTTSCKTQSSAPEDGKNNCPKHIELTGIINKSSLPHHETSEICLSRNFAECTEPLES